MIDELLRLANEWWLTNKISEEKAKLYHRRSFKELKELINYKQIIILTGLRRVGKSTLMFQLIKEFLKKADKKNILYFNFDEKKIEPMDVLKEYGKITGVEWKNEKCFIFLTKYKKLMIGVLR